MVISILAMTLSFHSFDARIATSNIREFRETHFITLRQHTANMRHATQATFSSACCFFYRWFIDLVRSLCDTLLPAQHFFDTQSYSLWENIKLVTQISHRVCGVGRISTLCALNNSPVVFFCVVVLCVWLLHQRQKSSHRGVRTSCDGRSSLRARICELLHQQQSPHRGNCASYSGRSRPRLHQRPTGHARHDRQSSIMIQ